MPALSPFMVQIRCESLANLLVGFPFPDHPSSPIAPPFCPPVSHPRSPIHSLPPSPSRIAFSHRTPTARILSVQTNQSRTSLSRLPCRRLPWIPECRAHITLPPEPRPPRPSTPPLPAPLRLRTRPRPQAPRPSRERRSFPDPTSEFPSSSPSLALFFLLLSSCFSRCGRFLALRSPSFSSFASFSSSLASSPLFSLSSLANDSCLMVVSMQRG